MKKNETVQISFRCPEVLAKWIEKQVKEGEGVNLNQTDVILRVLNEAFKVSAKLRKSRYVRNRISKSKKSK